MARIDMVQPLGGLNLGASIQNAANLYQQGKERDFRDSERSRIAQERDANAIRQQEMDQRFKPAWDSGDYNTIYQMGVDNPEITKAFDSAQAYKSDETKALRREALRRISMGADPLEVTSELVPRISAAGGNPEHTMQIMELAKTDPEGARKMAEGYQSILFGDDYKSVMDFRRAQSEPALDVLPSEILAGVPDDQKAAAAAAYSAAGGGEKGLNAASKLIDRGVKVKEKEEAKVKAAQSLIDQAQSVNELVSRIENSDGLSGAVGAKGLSSGFGLFGSPVAGTAAADVVADIETLEAKNFLASIKDFKAAGGAGALSDSEGKKLGAALTSLNRDQSEKNFKRNLKVIKDLTQKMIAGANKTLGVEQDPVINEIGTLGTQDLSDDDLLNKYGGR